MAMNNDGKIDITQFHWKGSKAGVTEAVATLHNDEIDLLFKIATHQAFAEGYKQGQKDAEEMLKEAIEHIPELINDLKEMRKEINCLKYAAGDSHSI